ncbi:SseB family protein [Ectobacillus ponti]|uniref:SseB family protein n=1 Tax=Ectobacillus ponti TaxID=2961894 RepID=A0AA41X7Z6_9BACI|nr:SseB family protein [Ectobacillus ponti]MCP8968555.1 SseB family protein [Ectobacillus ponti]
MADITISSQVEAMLLLAKNDPNKRKLFYQAFLESFVYVAGTLEEEEGARQGTMTLKYFQGDGRWILPIFTKLEYLAQAIVEDMPVISVRVKELFEQVDPEATVVLNVGTELDKTFSPEEVQDLVSGEIFKKY